jgi:hypothetical protein
MHNENIKDLKGTLSKSHINLPKIVIRTTKITPRYRGVTFFLNVRQGLFLNNHKTSHIKK